MRLAIIEDDAKQSEALARLVALLAPGARVECAPDGFSAGLLLGAFLPHIAFVDIEMPSLDGIEVIKRSMETASLRDIHFVVVSGRLTPDRVRVLDGLGVRDIVRKPISPDTVRRVLRGRASAAPRHGARR